MLWLVSPAFAATLSVGPSGEFAAPCAAIAAAEAGDTIEVDAAGDYAGDTCAWSTDNLTIRGVNGQPVLDGTGAAMAEQKGIFVIHAEHATVENLAFIGAAVADDNGAGIRHQGTDLVVDGCLFRDNQNGILGSPIADGTGSVTIIRSEFDHNGAGDGYSHNIYLGHYASVTMRASYSRRGNVGHLFKSRALLNVIEASRLSDESGGAASYEIDLPNAGEAWIVASLVEQVATTQNSGMIAYGEESSGMNPAHDLHIVNSTLLNHHDRGTFLSVGGDVSAPVTVVNTLFVGPGTLSSQSTMQRMTCWEGSEADAGLVDPANLDVHLQANSPAVDAGTAPPEHAPDAEYAHPADEIPRGVAGGGWDIGAYEFGNPGVVDDGDADTSSDTSGDVSGEGCGCSSSGASGGLPLVLAWIATRGRRQA